MVRVLFLCLLATACASPRYADLSSVEPARLIADAPISAPQGLIDYCQRNPWDCGGAPSAALRGRDEATGAAHARVSAPARSGASLFQTMMGAHRASLQAGARAYRHEMALSPTRWDDLVRVSGEVNRAIRPITDMTLYGVNEFWTRPILAQGGAARGDCEDYALEKRARLIALGWSPDMLAMATAMAPGVGLHAVLIVQTDRGDFVLDNLAAAPRPLAEVNYLWLTRQSGASLTQWASVGIEGASHRVNAVETPEQRFQRMMRARTRGAEVQTIADRAPHPDGPSPQQAEEVLAPVREEHLKGELKPELPPARTPKADLVRSALA